jgi:hypothetical protein
MVPCESNAGQQKEIGESHARDRKTLAAEIRAIATIGRVLGDIPDVITRARILCWANERFMPEVSEETALRPDERQQAPVPDPLDDLFERPREIKTSERAAFVLDRATQPQPSKRGLLVDFRLLGRRLARRMKHSA